MIITLLRKERQKKGWTLDMVSTRIGIAIQTLHDIETGRRKPSYDVLLKLEDLFNLPHRQLFAAVVGEPTPAENEMPLVFQQIPNPIKLGGHRMTNPITEKYSQTFQNGTTATVTFSTDIRCYHTDDQEEILHTFASWSRNFYLYTLGRELNKPL